MPGLVVSPASDSVVTATRLRNLDDISASAFIRHYERARRTAPIDVSGDLIVHALRANPESAVARRLYGELLLVKGHVAEALPHLRNAVEMRPDDAAARRALAFALHGSGRVLEAVSHYEAALAVRPDDAECQNNFGAALAELGDRERARRHLETAARLAPEWQEPRNNLARLARDVPAR